MSPDSAAMAAPSHSSWSYSERDVILYALSVGCRWSEGRWTYENHESFSVLPTFGVLPLHNGALRSFDIAALLPKYNPMMVLHGEQYLELARPLPPAGSLRTETRVVDVLDKGKAAVVVLGLTSRDAESGHELAYNEVTTFVRGAGGFGGPASPKPRRAAAVAQHPVPTRPPDAVIEEATSADQAALYRLNGDENPLHIDPEFAGLAGFPRPILHGLCTFGVAAKHALQAFGDSDPARFRSIKGRFAKHVFPGERLRTEMWREPGGTIVLQVRVVERNELALSNAAVLLLPPPGAAQPAKL